MTATIVDQRDIQKIGGVVAKFPSAYVVGEILRDANAYSVLDVTYGKGRFYVVYRPKLLVGADPKRWDWIVEPDEFYEVPVWRVGEVFNGEADVVVCDPPQWNMGVRYRRRGEYGYIVGTPELIVRCAVDVARRVDATYLLLHFNRLVDLPIERDVQMRWAARYLYSEKPRVSHYTLYRV
jgi:hypothetical protein